MESVDLAARERVMLGKEACRKLRGDHEIPGILYGGDGGNIPLILSPRDLKKALEQGGGENVLINLMIVRDREKMVKTVMVKDLQIHPMRGEYLHVDFLQISMDKPIRVEVPIVLRGEAPGVKVSGGLLDHVLREVEVECLPAAIPESLHADVSSLEIGDILHVKDLETMEGVKILEDLERVVASVSPPLKEVEEVPEAPLVEPEVVTKKEAKEEEAG